MYLFDHEAVVNLQDYKQIVDLDILVFFTEWYLAIFEFK